MAHANRLHGSSSARQVLSGAEVDASVALVTCGIETVTVVLCLVCASDIVVLVSDIVTMSGSSSAGDRVRGAFRMQPAEGFGASSACGIMTHTIAGDVGA